jgi:hypothetical protein
MQHCRFLIIGAGPTGLAAASWLHELNQEDWLILEAAREAGGLARSFVDDKGFTRVIGGWLELPPTCVLDLDARPLHSLPTTEQFVSFACRRSRQMSEGTARIFNTYGPRMHPNDGRVVSNFVVQALLGNDITIYGDGSQTRSFCYVDDRRLGSHDGQRG